MPWYQRMTEKKVMDGICVKNQRLRESCVIPGSRPSHCECPGAVGLLFIMADLQLCCKKRRPESLPAKRTSNGSPPRYCRQESREVMR